MRQRDSRKGKLYAAENRAEVALAAAELLPELDGSTAAAQAFVDRVLRSAWWRQHAARQRPITVLAIRGEGGYYEPGMAPTISLGRSARRHAGGAVTAAPISSPLIILHELAHAATPHGCASHGREFARLLLGLTRRFLGVEAWRVLRAELVAGKVPHRAVPSSSTPRRGNPEALAAFRRVGDGEWIVTAELVARDDFAISWRRLRARPGRPLTFYVRDYDSARLLVSVDRAAARVWKTRATAERWAAAWAERESYATSGWRVEPLDDAH